MNLSSRFLAFTLYGAGWVLWLLVALSVVSVAIILERLWYLGTHEIDGDHLLAEARSFLARKRGERHDAAAGGGRPIEAAIEKAKAVEQRRLERNLAYLATLGSNAPFIGLFGTILGIIKAFHDLAHAQTQGPSVVMAGISEALVATAVGLLVAIPAVVAFNYFNRRVRKRLTEVDWAAHLARGRLESEISGGALRPIGNVSRATDVQEGL